MKQCGYRPGLCSNPSICDLRPVGFGDVKKFLALSRAAGSCSYFVPLAGAGQLKLNLNRRRRDWDVGNPYNEGKEID